jgi:hypothetical protein
MTDNENALVVYSALHHTPTLFAATPTAAQRVLEFLTAQINNDHTRKAYLNATRRSTEWCATPTASESSAMSTSKGAPLRIWV